MGETCSCDRGEISAKSGEGSEDGYNTERLNDELVSGKTPGGSRMIEDESELSSSQTASDIRSKTAALLAGESSEGRPKTYGVMITRHSDTSGAETDPLDSTDDSGAEHSDEELDDSELESKKRAIQQMGALIRLSAQGQSLDIESIAQKETHVSHQKRQSLTLLHSKKESDEPTDKLMSADGMLVSMDSDLYEVQDSEDEDDTNTLEPGAAAASRIDENMGASKESLLAMSAYKIHSPISTASIEIRIGVVYFDKDLPDLSFAGGSSGIGSSDSIRAVSLRQRSVSSRSKSSATASKKKREIKVKASYKQSAVSSTGGVAKKLGEKSEWHVSRGYDGDIIDIRETLSFPLFANGKTELPVLFKRQASSLASAATGLVWRVRHNLEFSLKQKGGTMKKDKFVGYASFPIEDYMDSGLLSRDGDWTEPINLEFFKTAEEAGFAKEMKKLAKKQAKSSKRKGSVIGSRRGSRQSGSKLSKGSSMSSVLSTESNDSDVKTEEHGGFVIDETNALEDDVDVFTEGVLGTIDEGSGDSTKREGFIQMECRLFWPPSVMEQFHKYTAEEAAKTSYVSLKGGSSPMGSSKAGKLAAGDSQASTTSPSADTSISSMLRSDFGPIAFTQRYHSQLKLTVLGVLFDSRALQDWDYMSLKNLTNTLQTLGTHSEMYGDELSGISLTSQRKTEDELREKYSSQEYSSKSSDVVFIGEEWLFNITKYTIEETTSMGSMGLSMHPQSSFVLGTHGVNKSPGSILITVVDRDTSTDHLKMRAIDRRMSKKNVGCSLIKIESLIRACSISMGSKVSEEQLFIQPMFVPIDDITNRKMVKECSKRTPIQNGAVFLKYSICWSRKMK